MLQTPLRKGDERGKARWLEFILRVSRNDLHLGSRKQTANIGKKMKGTALNLRQFYIRNNSLSLSINVLKG